MIFLLASIFCPKIIFILHFVMLRPDCSNSNFDYYLWLVKQLRAIVSPPSMQSSIKKKLEMIEGVNQHYLFLFFASLWVLPNWRRWSFGRWYRGPHSWSWAHSKYPQNETSNSTSAHWCSLKMPKKFHFSILGDGPIGIPKKTVSSTILAYVDMSNKFIFLIIIKYNCIKCSFNYLHL